MISIGQRQLHTGDMDGRTSGKFNHKPKQWSPEHRSAKHSTHLLHLEALEATVTCAARSRLALDKSHNVHTKRPHLPMPNPQPQAPPPSDPPLLIVMGHLDPVAQTSKPSL